MKEGTALSFPRATSLTEAFLAPAAIAVPVPELHEIRARLLRELPPLADELPENARLQIGPHELAVARDHPDRCASGWDPFVPSPIRCKRAIGIAAVERCVRGRANSPQAAVAEVLASGLEDLVTSASVEGAPRPPWWSEWYRELAPGARAAVQAEAVTWATQLWTALDWSCFERPPVIGGRDDFWDCPGGRQLVVRGRAEVRAWAQSRPVMLVVASGFPGDSWRADLAHRALVVALARGERSVPARVAGLWPTSGLVRLCEVDGPALSEAATALVSATATWVDAMIGAPNAVRVAC